MKYRTDLAIENQELLEQARTRAAGYIKKQRQIDEDISVIQIDIVSPEGEKAFGKPQGTYITIEVEGILEQKDGIRERTCLLYTSKCAGAAAASLFLKIWIYILA